MNTEHMTTNKETEPNRDLPLEEFTKELIEELSNGKEEGEL